MEPIVNKVDFYISDHDLQIVVPIIGTLVSFVIFWFMWQSRLLKSKLDLRFGTDIGSAKLVIYTKIIGGLIMFLLPALSYKLFFPQTELLEFGWVIPSDKLFDTVLWTIGFSILMIILIGRNARGAENLKHYPQIRAKQWTKSMMIGNLIAWAVYLFGYEAMFRGVLLFPLVKNIGIWPAIAINIALYAGTHIPKGLKETVGSIPLGIVLCMLTINFENILLPVIVHISMAWTNEMISFKHQSEMLMIR